MSIIHRNNVPLSSLSTFKIGGLAKEVVVLENENDIAEFFKNFQPDKKWIILGGGSNVIFPDGDYETTIIQYTPNKIIIGEEKEGKVEVESDAGTDWDSFVEFTVKNGLSGAEPLSFIPGKVGSTPVQNVGAYGIEIKDIMLSLRAYDCRDNKFVILSNEDCKFGYRDSIFKNDSKGRYIITQIKFLLSKDLPKIPQYNGVSEYFKEKGISQPNLENIRNAIISIRMSKLPDPREIASVGSFFKNPIVSKEKGTQLKNDFPKLAVFPIDDLYTKIGAGSLIDVLGWKGLKEGNISIYANNALVLVNDGEATKNELMAFVNKLILAIKDKFGVSLETEPEFL